MHNNGRPASDKRALGLQLSRLDAASRALLLSQAGPHAAQVFTVVFPSSAEVVVPSLLFRVLLLRHLRLPLPVAPRLCACRGRLDPLGDHRAAFATLSGPLHCHEAGARVAGNVRLANMNIDVPVFDDRRIEVVANGLSLWHGAQQAVDTTLVSPVTRAGDPHPGVQTCILAGLSMALPDANTAKRTLSLSALAAAAWWSLGLKSAAALGLRLPTARKAPCR